MHLQPVLPLCPTKDYCRWENPKLSSLAQNATVAGTSEVQGLATGRQGRRSHKDGRKDVALEREHNGLVQITARLLLLCHC